MATQNTYIFYLRPVSGFRTELRSDTLWGLLCWGMRFLYGESSLNRFLESYDTTPELLISSTFPFKTQGANNQLFFPIPFLPMDALDTGDDNMEAYLLKKRVKKMKWLNLEDFNQLLQGKLNRQDIWERAKEQHEMSSADSLTFSAYQQRTADKRPPVTTTKSFTHNTIDRINLSTLQIGNTSGQLFHVEEKFIVDEDNESSNLRNTGLFFLAQGTEETIKKVAAILRFYRFNGLGGDRSVGKGTFDITYSPFAGFEEPSDANAFTCLSLFRPNKSEEINIQNDSDNPVLNYLIERRAGIVGVVNQRIPKQPLLYFKEGSVFPLKKEKDYFGETLRFQDSSTPHPYYSLGHAFTVKMKIAL